MVFGGLGAIFLGANPFPLVFANLDIRSVFFAAMFFIVVLVLAYLTNPSEISFRAYLTEQSFRQHLSRLDDAANDDLSDSEDAAVHYTISRHSKSHRLPVDSEAPFHFLNRTALSLRTPKHVFHSFGIFTVAAVLPTPRTSHPDAAQVSDSWFLGAFGRWCRGGVLQPWWYDSLANPKHADRSVAGILDVKPLDDFDGLPFARPLQATQDVVSRLRTVDRPTPRSTTPPPLPKSASLPLHAPRQPIAAALSKPAPSVAPDPRPSIASLFDHSPAIADVLRQISHSQAENADLRARLADVAAAAAASYAAGQRDLEVQRERKRTEDAGRAELKARTKALEDARRSADATKRDAEKRYKAAVTARDSASERVDRLSEQIDVLRERMAQDDHAVQAAQHECRQTEGEIGQEMDRKRKEIGVAEEVVAALSARAKALEERIVQEEERLRKAREDAEIRKQDRSFYPLHVVPGADMEDVHPWSPTTSYTSPAQAQDPHMHIDSDYAQHIDVFSHPQSRSRQGSDSSFPSDMSASPHPHEFGLPTFRKHSDADLKSTMCRPPGFPDLPPSVPLVSAQPPRFSTYNHTRDVSASMPVPIPVRPGHPMTGGAISPVSSSLIPSSLIQSLEGTSPIDALSRSFQSESDDVLVRGWRKLHPLPPPVESPATFSASPTSLTCPSFDAIDQDDPFEVRPPPPRRPLPTVNRPDFHAAPQPLTRAHTHEEHFPAAYFPPRRWFSAFHQEERERETERRGLNPQAKVFSITKPPVFELPPGAPALPIPRAAPFSSISMRAFAPSPAEREALHRALGGSTNTSLERLPTLSEVSTPSMPPSPAHVPAIAASGDNAGRTLLAPGFAWLHSLPRMRKMRFSPWEDELPTDSAVDVSR